MNKYLQAPEPYFAVETRSGNLYKADRVGIIQVPAQALSDVKDLQDFGCSPVGFLARLLDADMNTTDDQPFELMTSLSYRIDGFLASGATPVALDTAVGGIYAEVSKGGTAVVGAGQLYSDLTAQNLAVDLALAAGQGQIVRPVGFTPILSLTTPQGVAAQCDFFMYGTMLGGY
jgi:hypothetical protein